VPAPVLRETVKLVAHLLVEVLRPNHDPSVSPGTDRRERTKVDRGRHHESSGIIRVFANQVHAARGHKNRGFGAEPLGMFFLNTVYIQHAGPFSAAIPAANTQKPRM
jgi:hypothetical protein